MQREILIKDDEDLAGAIPIAMSLEVLTVTTGTSIATLVLPLSPRYVMTARGDDPQESAGQYLRAIGVLDP